MSVLRTRSMTIHAAENADSEKVIREIRINPVVPTESVQKGHGQVRCIVGRSSV